MLEYSFLINKHIYKQRNGGENGPGMFSFKAFVALEESFRQTNKRAIKKIKLVKKKKKQASMYFRNNNATCYRIQFI